MAWIGLLLGAVIGASVYGFRGLMAGAAAGSLLGLVLRKPPVRAVAQRDAGVRGLSTSAAASEKASARRSVMLEQRVVALEAALARSGIESPSATPAAAESAAPPPSASEGEGVASPAAGIPVGGTPPVLMPAPQAPVRKGGVGEPGPAAAVPAPSRASASAASATPSLWSWFTNGNTMARIGIVVLFFGIAFLLSYLAEHVTIPIELQFAGVALAGGALIGAGAWLAQPRPRLAVAALRRGAGRVFPAHPCPLPRRSRASP